MKSFAESNDSQKIALTGSWIDVKLCTEALPAPRNNSDYKLLIDRIKAETLAQLNVKNKEF